jgi:DNA primase
MSLVIELAPEEEQQLTQRAAAQGVAPDDYARRLIADDLRHDVQRAKNQATIDWLQSRIEEGEAMSDEEKQQAEAEWRETARSIDENRTSYRKLFPELSS